MDAAIVSPAKILSLVKISEEHQTVCRDLINDNRRFADDGICVYDPLTELTNLFEGVSTKEARIRPSLADLPIEERLKQHHRWRADRTRAGSRSSHAELCPPADHQHLPAGWHEGGG